MRVVACDPMDGQGDDADEDEDVDEEGEYGEGGSRGRGRAGGASSSAPRDSIRAASRHEWADAAAAGVVRADSLQELLETSDVVSLHAPANRVTAEMISQETLTWFKRGALLVNVASGALVNAVELKQALLDGQLGGAAVDCPEGITWLQVRPSHTAILVITPDS
jgi:lactate dehydrogenase-like 2-hydroxyacid dehydrogenase